MNNDQKNIERIGGDCVVEFRHHHVTSISIYVLSIWLMWCIWSLRHANFDQVLIFFKTPTQLVCLFFLFLFGFYHINIAFQDILKDYSNNRYLSIKLQFIKCATMCLFLISVISVVKYIFGA